MRTINITFTVSERQYEYLCLAKSEKPNPQHIKLMLLSQAASLLRRMGEQAMHEARQQDQPLAKSIKWKDVPATKAPAKPYETLADIEARHAATRDRINKKFAEKATRKAKPSRAPTNGRVLRNSKADSLVPFTPTPLEDYEF